MEFQLKRTRDYQLEVSPSNELSLLLDGPLYSDFKRLELSALKAFLAIPPQYVHPAKVWEDKAVLSGATVISNLTIDSLGHPIDWTTRTLTPANIGAEPANTNIQEHISATDIHFTQAQISITESQISDLKAYLPLTGGTLSNFLSLTTNGLYMDRMAQNNAIYFASGVDANHALWNAYATTDVLGNRSGGTGWDGVYWNTWRGIQIRGGVGGAYNMITAISSAGVNNGVVTLYGSGVARLSTNTDGISINGHASVSGYFSSSSFVPLRFTANGNTGTYNATSIYANQNDTTANVSNGIFIERGRLTDAAGAEVRYFVIGARGGQIQWQVDGVGNTWQSGAIVATSLAPSVNNSYDIGNSSYKYKDVYVAGTINSGSFNANGTYWGGAFNGTTGNFSDHITEQTSGTAYISVKSTSNSEIGLYIQRNNAVDTYNIQWENYIAPNSRALNWWNATGGIVFSLAHTGAATFSSTIAASNFSGSSSGTNTGDQNLAPYANTLNTLQTVTNNGATTTSGVTIGGNLSYSGTTESRYIILGDTGSHSGTLALQAGFGSAAAGGSVKMYGQSNATLAGYVDIGITAAGALFRIQDYGIGNGSTLLSVDRSGNLVVANTLYLYNTNASIATSVSTLNFGTVGVERYRINAYGNHDFKSGTVLIGNTLTSQRIVSQRPSNKVDGASFSEFRGFHINNAFGAGASGYVKVQYSTEANLMFYSDYDGNIGGTIPSISFGNYQGASLTLYNNLSAAFGSTVSFGGTITTTSVVIPSFESSINVLSFRSGIPDGTNVGIRAKAIETSNRDGIEILGYNGINFTVNNGATVAGRFRGVSSGVAGRLDLNNGLTVVGNITASSTMTAVNFTATSDRIFKYNILPLSHELAFLLNPISHTWKDGREKGTHVGFVADEVAKVHRELVYGEVGNQSVAYMKITAINNAAIKYIKSEVDMLRDRVAFLEQELSNLKN